ncbi:MAG: hypothetical protein CM15mP84_10530 [Cellvibrionales bacterium]|nr:MAG: hypothetical protein CM15mP84_10530 [Cellvibrionales bacterium]
MSPAYDEGIGDWTTAILWGYQDFPPKRSDAGRRRHGPPWPRVMSLWRMSMRGGASDQRRALRIRWAVLWDNGSDPVAEIESVLWRARCRIAGFLGAGDTTPVSQWRTSRMSSCPPT